jgi:two-component system, chemotaxis family, sensor kinase CheA
MTEDMSQYLGLFLDEASEQMELLERDILQLEQSPSKELLNGIFRAAHTLKGSSRAMGFTSMGELTHAMEDIFDRLRQDTLVATRELIDALFAGLDTLKAMQEEIAASGSSEMDTTVQTSRLRAVMEGTAETSEGESQKAKGESGGEAIGESAAPSPAPVLAPTSVEHHLQLTEPQIMSAQDACDSGCSLFGMKVRIAEDCVMKSVRAVMVLQALEHVGSILTTTPNEEALENEEFEAEFEVLVATKKSKVAVRAAVLGITEIVGVDIFPWAEQGVEGNSGSPTPSNAHHLQLTGPQQMAAQDADEAGNSLFGLKVRVAEDCVMKSVRAVMVLQSLERVGSILTTTPEEEALENEEFETEFEVLVATTQNEEMIRQTVMGITEIVGVDVFVWAGEGADGETGVSGVGCRVSETPTNDQRQMTNEEAAKPKARGESATPDTRHQTPDKTNERVVDAGPEARGKAPDEVQKIAGEKKQAQTVRVDVSRLDKLLNLVGELVMDRNRIAQLCSQIEQQFTASDTVDHLHETAAHVGRITDELQEEIMKARMLPIDNVFSRFPRMVRDLAQKLEKEVQFVVEGGETELDRSVIEVIGDPLIHMLRNSVDHGIELPDEREKAGKPRGGTVRLSARHEENHIVIDIVDDGKGMDPEKLRAHAVRKGVLTEEAASRLSDRDALGLIFAPGFSTAQVVSDVSGRGVGMDIVRSNLQRLGAQVDIESRVGIGSKFTVKMPLTLAIIRGLLINVRGCVYALPLASVVETIRVPSEEVHVINHQEVILQRGRVLPIIRLRQIFRMEAELTPAERMLNAGLGPASDLAEMVTTAVVAQEGGKPRRGEKGKGKREKGKAGQSVEMTAEPQILNPEIETSTLAVTQRPSDAPLYIVIIGNAEKQYGLIVDSLIGEQEVVIKTLSKFLGEIRGISGATILGDGRVALIIDISGLVAVAAEEKGLAYAA